MSSGDVNVLKELALVAGTSVVSGASYYAALYYWSRYIPVCSAISKISQATSVPIAGLRLLVSNESGKSGVDRTKELLVVVRGVTKANLRNTSINDSLVSHVSREECIVLEQTWCSASCERKTLLVDNPFIIRGIGNQASEVFVNLEGSNHQLPLKVYDLPLNDVSTRGAEYLVQEKWLPVGKMITAIGMCSFQDGKLQIKGCNDIPFFLTGKTEYQMVSGLIIKRNHYWALSFVLASFSLSLFMGFAAPKIYILWKKWKQRKEL